MTLYLSMTDEVIKLDPRDPATARVVLDGKRVSTLATDPHMPDVVYCGTHDAGLWRSHDAGESWRRVGAGDRGITHDAVVSVSISPLGKHGVPGVVLAGTSPSALFRSGDGGETWSELESMKRLPSSAEWSFPPEPDTHHGRWIVQHPVFPRRIVVAIEAGALIQTIDGGETWIDRIPGGPFDTHSAVILPDRPDRILCAAGDGFFESLDCGRTWRTPEEGLPFTYCWSIAADADDPHLTLMSVAPGPGQGHTGGDRARSAICRRYDDRPWVVVGDGLPDQHGMSLSAIASDPGRRGTFYALNNHGVFESTDSAWTWSRIEIPWKDQYLAQRPPAIAVSAV